MGLFSAAALTSPFDSRLLSEAVSPCVRLAVFRRSKKICVFWQWPTIKKQRRGVTLRVALRPFSQRTPKYSGQESISGVVIIFSLQQHGFPRWLCENRARGTQTASLRAAHVSFN